MTTPDKDAAQEAMRPILRFAGQLRRRLTLRGVLASTFQSLLVTAALTLAYAGATVLQGYAVDRSLLPLAGAIGGGLFLLLSLLRWVPSQEAITVGDRFFQLEECLVSAIDFHEEQRDGEFY
ncbi:MAG: hypothetical protein ACYTGH_21665, partial [Planctomycetota bacterium]